MGPSGWFERRPRAEQHEGRRQNEEALRDVLLTRHYCSADCLLDAEKRGFPQWKVNRIRRQMGLPTTRRSGGMESKRRPRER